MMAVAVRTPRLQRFACAVGLLSMMLAPAALAQGNDDAFKRGIDARNNLNWTAAIAEMRRAIEGSPRDDGRKVRMGGVLGIGAREVEYLPHFFLGEALFKRGDCVAAVESWAVSEEQGAVRANAGFLAILQNGYAECEKKGVLPPVKFNASVARTAQQINEANEQARKISALGQANQESWRTEMRDQYVRATGEIDTAGARLAAGRKSRADGDFREAGAALERAQGILVKLESTLSAAIETRRSFANQVGDIEQLIDAAEGVDRSIDGRAVGLTPSLTGARQEGRDALSRARSRLDSGRGTSNPAALIDARASALDASSRFTRVLEELTRLEKAGQERQLADALTGAREAFSFIDQSFATLDRLVAQRPGVLGPDKTAEREAIARDVARARRRYDAARKIENLADVTEATRLTVGVRDRLSALIAIFGPVTLTDRGLHPALFEGAALFFRGEYRQALAALDPPGGFGAEVPLELHVHLFRAAAFHALFERSPAADRSLRAQALAEVEQVKLLNAAFQPDLRAFGPRFLAFFQSGGADVEAVVPAAPSR
jgi:hypothetical protein